MPHSPLNPQRTIDELKELRALTGNADGAQRVCWTDTWAQARAWLKAKLAELPVEVVTDEAGNLWATLRGHTEPQHAGRAGDAAPHRRRRDASRYRAPGGLGR